MAYFRLLNLRSVEKALADLFDSLARTNKLCLLPNLVKEKSLCHRKVPMDGFTLFTSSPLIKPYTWFLGNHKVNIVQFLRVYEELASLPLSMVGTAGEVASKIYSKTSEERKVFLKFKEGEWLNPSLLLAAAAQYLGPEGVTASRSGVRMDLGGGRITQLIERHQHRVVGGDVGEPCNDIVEFGVL